MNNAVEFKAKLDKIMYQKGQDLENKRMIMVKKQMEIGNVQLWLISWQFCTLDGVLPNFYLPEKIMKKFVKLCLHLSKIVQNYFHFDEISKIPNSNFEFFDLIDAL